MGLFDSLLKKATKAVSNTLLDEIGNTIKDNLNINQTINNESTHNIPNTTNTSKTYEIPEKYNEFPKYPGQIIKKPVERTTDKYIRITLRYNGTPSADYISTLLQAGFVQGSSVRYDKNNTYVIVDNLGKQTEIVYHIKK